jgi:Dyp-type peroxidase family
LVRLASKMVGRWPSGAPLALSPERDDPAMGDRDDFGYRREDSEGMRCPIGAHIRRSNPRDGVDVAASKAIKIANRHRILRRGRTYGAALAPSLEPLDLLRAAPDHVERGLYFICVNADISRQFEFVQSSWINSPKFNGLFDERDPIAGNHHALPANPGNTGIFSVPGDGLRQRCVGIPQFVTTRGGAYFFLPGLRALRYLTSL